MLCMLLTCDRKYDCRLDGLTPNASHNRSANGVNGSSSAKRKSEFGTPTVSKVGKTEMNDSPTSLKLPDTPVNGGAVDGIRY